MSIVLTVYSRNAYKEFVLPAIHNAETSLYISRKMFNLQRDLKLTLEQLDGVWRFKNCKAGNFKYQNAEEQTLTDGMNVLFETKTGDQIFIIVQYKESSFVAYDKYDISNVRELTVGSGEDVSVYYSYGVECTVYLQKACCDSS